MKEADFALAAWGRISNDVPIRIMMRKLKMSVLSGVRKRIVKFLIRFRIILYYLARMRSPRGDFICYAKIPDPLGRSLSPQEKGTE
jgi:hypothetical protein